MENGNTLWWILQLQLPGRNENQLDLFSEPIPRPDLIRKSLSFIPQNIRIHRGESLWGLADLNKISDDLFAFKLIVRPPFTRIAEEHELGFLEETIDPRYFTLSIFYVPKQIIVVHRSSDVSRYARSAKTFADIYERLFEKAIESLEMQYHYNVEVDPIAKFGSFVEWVNSIDLLKKITVKYTGQNLPAGAGNLVSTIRDTASRYKKALNSKDVELVANDPKLEKEEVEELDSAVAARRLKLRARGLKSGVGSTWSSSDKPVPETAIMPLTEEQIEDTQMTAVRMVTYIDERFGRDEIEDE
jgi:hypothetical protein